MLYLAKILSMERMALTVNKQINDYANKYASKQTEQIGGVAVGYF